MQGFFTVKELAAKNNTHVKTIKNNVLAKGCPHVKTGEETYIRTESFLEWLKENEQRSGSSDTKASGGLMVSVGSAQTESPVSNQQEPETGETLNGSRKRRKPSLPRETTIPR